MGQGGEYGPMSVTADKKQLILFSPPVIFQLEIISDSEIFCGSIDTDVENLLYSFPDYLDCPAAHPPCLVVEEPTLMAMNEEDISSEADSLPMLNVVQSANAKQAAIASEPPERNLFIMISPNSYLFSFMTFWSQEDLLLD